MNAHKTPRTVLDTSVIVSGLISPKGSPAKIITHWLQGEFQLLYMPSMYAEIKDVLNRAWLKERLSNTPNRIPEFLEAFEILGELIRGYVNVTGSIRDPFDEMFLMCAILGKADFIVSVDKDLLSIDTFQNIPILTPSQFIDEIIQ